MSNKHIIQYFNYFVDIHNEYNKSLLYVKSNNYKIFQVFEQYGYTLTEDKHIQAYWIEDYFSLDELKTLFLNSKNNSIFFIKYPINNHSHDNTISNQNIKKLIKEFNFSNCDEFVMNENFHHIIIKKS